MNGVEVRAQREKYHQCAVAAKDRADQAPTDVDRVAWLLIAESWLNLLPLINGPSIDPPNEAQKMPLVERLEKLRQLEHSSA